jgi:hypothetical protein
MMVLPQNYLELLIALMDHDYSAKEAPYPKGEH